MRETKLRTKECPPGINLQHEIEPLKIRCIGPRQLNRASVIDQNIDPTKGSDTFRDRMSNLFIRSNIHSYRQRFSAGLFYLFRRSINRTGQPRMRRRGLSHYRNISPVSRRSQRNRETDPPTGPGDKQSAALQATLFHRQTLNISHEDAKFKTVKGER
jgi:hypothetical protein